MPIDLQDYDHDARDRGWGRGWRPCDNANQLAKVSAAASGAAVTVHRRVSVLIDLLLDATETTHGYRLKRAECGGWNCRPISGTNTPSNHSWGLAIDLNWNDNPFTTSGRHDLPTPVARMFNRYGWAWGGDYRGAKKDWMHLEFMGTPADADAMTGLALQELIPLPRTSEDAVALERLVPTRAPADPAGGGRWQDTDPRTWPDSGEVLIPLAPPSGPGEPDNWRGSGAVSTFACGWAPGQDAGKSSGFIHYIRVFHHRDVGTAPAVYDHVPAGGWPMAGNWSLTPFNLPGWSRLMLIKYAAPGGLGICIEYEH